MDFRGAAQERSGLKPPLPHPFLLVALGHHQRGRKAGGGGGVKAQQPPPESFLWDTCRLYSRLGEGTPQEAGDPDALMPPPPGVTGHSHGAGGRATVQDHRWPQIPGPAPPHTHPMLPLQQSSRQSPQPLGRGPGGDVLHRITGLKTAPEGTPHPTPLGTDRSRGPKSAGGAAGFQANGGLGERRPSEGHAALSPSCRTQAGEKGGRGGPARHGCAPQLAHFPI